MCEGGAQANSCCDVRVRSDVMTNVQKRNKAFLTNLASGTPKKRKAERREVEATRKATNNNLQPEKEGLVYKKEVINARLQRGLHVLLLS